MSEKVFKDSYLYSTRGGCYEQLSELSQSVPIQGAVLEVTLKSANGLQST